MRCPVSGVRPASVDKIVTIFMDRSSPNLEHSFPVSYRSKVFFAVRSEVVYAHARPLFGTVVYQGHLGGSSGTAESDLCDPTSSSTSADIDEIGRHRQKVIKSTTTQLLQSDSLLAYAAC